ncbi:MAG TPA: hypothetical protein PL176_13665, partial [Kiritimatiellia bacterium]|nr:hypothetical protein [Kiritimatiellia bacterium]
MAGDAFEGCGKMLGGRKAVLKRDRCNRPERINEIDPRGLDSLIEKEGVGRKTRGPFERIGEGHDRNGYSMPSDSNARLPRRHKEI